MSLTNPTYYDRLEDVGSAFVALKTHVSKTKQMTQELLAALEAAARHPDRPGCEATTSCGVALVLATGILGDRGFKAVEITTQMDSVVDDLVADYHRHTEDDPRETDNLDPEDATPRPIHEDETRDDAGRQGRVDEVWREGTARHRAGDFEVPDFHELTDEANNPL
jgi:hypothetical protein